MGKSVFHPNTVNDMEMEMLSPVFKVSPDVVASVESLHRQIEFFLWLRPLTAMALLAFLCTLSFSCFLGPEGGGNATVPFYG